MNTGRETALSWGAAEGCRPVQARRARGIHVCDADAPAAAKSGSADSGVGKGVKAVPR